MHQRRKFDFRRGRRLGVEDHAVAWARPDRPDWMDEEAYAQVPSELTIRELRFTVEQPGFRVNELVLVTTMLDATAYSKEEVADLFIERWNVELGLRAIKDVLQMDVHDTQTPTNRGPLLVGFVPETGRKPGIFNRCHPIDRATPLSQAAV